MGHPRRWLLVAVALLIAAGGAAVAWSFSWGFSAEALEARIASLGVWAPIGFVLLYGIATVAMIPGGIFDLVGGALFGPYLGSVLDLAGGTLGAALAFLVGRYLARDGSKAGQDPGCRASCAASTPEGWRFVAFVRLVPIFPYNIVNYLLGVTRIPYHHYVLATVVFMAPSTIAYTWLGHASRALIAGDADTIYYALIALGLLAALFVLPRLFKRMQERRAEAALGSRTPRGESRAFRHGGELGEHHVGIDGRLSDPGAVAAIAAGDHVLTPDQFGVAANTLRDQFGMLDEIRLRFEHAGCRSIFLRFPQRPPSYHST